MTEQTLPSRKARGMTLSGVYDGERWSLHVQRLGLSASLDLASDLGVLTDKDGQERELSDKDMEVINEWAENYDAYVAQFEKGAAK